MQELTIEEKTRLLTGKGLWHTYDCNGKLPSIMMTDGPNGLRKQVDETSLQADSFPATCFPTESALAALWDVDAVKEMATAIAQEALAEQVSVVLGCGANIKRSPLGGRNFEYFSEDPYLSGVLATEYIKALQTMGVGASLKHFAGNNQETRRQTSNSQIDERALREIYLPAFEMAIKSAKPQTVMVSYNRLNGEYMTENKTMLKSILRDEWGYDGCVISDWCAVANLGKAISAGLDLEMPDSKTPHQKQLTEALNSGLVSQEDLSRAAANITKLVTEQAGKISDKKADFAAHHLLARRLAAESAVLLKNDNFFPISPQKTKKILVVGDLAVHMRFQGGGSSHIHITQDTNAVRSLGDAGFEVIYVKGYRPDREASVYELEKEAVKYAREGMPILFFGGMTEYNEGEGFDRTDIDIPRNQIELFKKLRYVNQNIAFISFGGSAMTYPILDEAKGVIHMYLAGQAVGEACTDVIVGNVNPSGKLPETFPKKLSDTPCYGYFGKPSDDVEYRESIFVGYRYYDTYDKEVLFPFGYGLSYTKFEYSDLFIDRKSYTDGEVKVSFKVKNVGQVAGKEVAQVYVQNPPCDYLRARKELRGFTKVSLGPGEIKEVTVVLNERSFTIYDERRKMFYAPAGVYEIQVGASSRDILLKENITIEGPEYGRDDRTRYIEYFHQQEDIFDITPNQFAQVYNKRLSNFDSIVKGNYTMQHSLEQLSRQSLLAKLILFFGKHKIRRTYRGKSKLDPGVRMMLQALKEGTIDSIICQSGGKISYNMGLAVVLEANGKRKEAFFKLIKR